MSTLLSQNTFAARDTPITSSADDFEPVAQNSVSVFADGGKDYVYIIDGVENHYLVPPYGFDPLIATDDELERYCFPSRPALSSTDYTEWEALMSNYTGTPDPQIETKKVPTKKSTMVSSTLKTTAPTTQYANNWSGYVAYLNTSSTTYYNQVQTDYTHPSISSISGWCYNAYWVGLGGWNSGNLVQAGTATIDIADHFAWYEYLSDTATSVNIQRITSLPINAGDSIHVYISFQKANNKFEYYVANNTTGQSAAAYITLSYVDYLDGTTAEWVVERTTGASGSLFQLGNYGTLSLTNCKATLNTSSTWLNLGTLSGLYKVIMTSNGYSSGTALSTPGSISPTNTQFSCTWNNYS
jgi:hypothetical protein